MLKTLTIIILFASVAAVSQTTCDSLHLLKKRTYGFRPLDLSEAQLETKNSELDVFWNTAKNNAAEAMPCLQAMIEVEKDDSFFSYDASALLARIDTSGVYLPTVVRGIAKSNPEELQLESYLQLCLYLNYKKHNVGTLVEKLISIPNAEIFLSGHFLTLNAIDASIFVYNNMSEETAEKYLKHAIEKGNATAKHNAAVVLNLLATDTGDTFINGLIANKQLAENTVAFIEKDRKAFAVKPGGSIGRAKILEHLNNAPYDFDKEFFGFAGNPDLISAAVKQLNKGDIPKIRAARQKSTPGLSDEALHEYFALTSILMTVRNKPN